MIKSWAFEFFFASREIEEFIIGAGGNPDEAVCADYAAKIVPYFNAYLDLWSSAERLGFDGLLLSEHHFGGGYSPSPNLLLPLIAERTKTLRLGVMGMVLPYHNAWRLVEEVGMLDILTGGRLEVGTAAGIPGEFQKIGLPTDEARARNDEALQILDAGLKSPVISHHGKFWDFDDLALVPRPIQFNIPVWTTVISVESARKAARRGAKIATGFIPTEQVKAVFDAYNEEADKAGNPTGPDQLGLRRQVIFELEEEGTAGRSGAYAEGFRNMIAATDKRMAAPARKALDSPGTHSYTMGDDEFISGTPEQVADTIREQCEATGAGHFQVVFAGDTTVQQLSRSWELYGTRVIPRLNAKVAGTVGA